MIPPDFAARTPGWPGSSGLLCARSWEGDTSDTFHLEGEVGGFGQKPVLSFFLCHWKAAQACPEKGNADACAAASSQGLVPRNAVRMEQTSPGHKCRLAKKTNVIYNKFHVLTKPLRAVSPAFLYTCIWMVLVEMRGLLAIHRVRVPAQLAANFFLAVGLEV